MKQYSNITIVFLIFLAWRTFDNWVMFFAQKIIPYLGFFPYPRELYDFGLAQVTSALANFDGIHYLLIAHRGGYEQWEQAFFPLYPIMIKLFTFVFNNELVSGLIVSNISFLIGLFFLFRLFEYKIINTKYWVLLFLLTFPTSFFFGAVYTEGLFFLLFILTLYFLKKEKYWLVSLFAILASLTRLIGVFLIIPIAFHLLGEYQKLNIKYQKYILNIKNFLLLTPILGLTIYSFYLWRTTGDPFFFLTSQPVFGANRSTNLIFLPQVIWRYLKIFFTASHNFQYFVSLFEFVMFFFVFTVLIFDLFKHLKLNKNFKFQIKNFYRLALNLFSFANILLPTLTGTLSSVPRYALFSLSVFLFLAEVKSKWIKIGIIIIFLILHIITLGFFGQGYFIS